MDGVLISGDTVIHGAAQFIERYANIPTYVYDSVAEIEVTR